MIPLQIDHLHSKPHLEFFLFFIYLFFFSFACVPRQEIQKPSIDLNRTKKDYPRILGAQVTLFESKDFKELGRSLDQMSAAGVNTLIFRVFQNRGDRKHGFVRANRSMGVYFNTDHAPLVEDVLSQVCDMAHERGLMVFAWMTTRQSDWLIQRRPDLGGWKLDTKTGKIGRTGGLDLFSPEVVVYLQNIYADLAQYPIDGILFQDDLVLRHTEGFGPHAEKRYLKRFGKVLHPSRIFTVQDKRLRYRPEFWNWARWKNQRILEVIDSIVHKVAETRPDIYWALNGYYESVTDPKNALAWYAQDLEKALDHRIDYLSLMAYHRQIMEELRVPYRESLQLLTAMSREAAVIAKNPHRVFIKIQTLNWHTEEPLPDSEIGQAFDAVLQGASPGLVYIRGKNPPSLNAIRRYFLPYSSRIP